MLVKFLEKQRRAASVVKTALTGVGIYGRSVCVQVDSWIDGNDDRREVFAVFIGSPAGVNEEPFYITGQTMVEAVKNMIDSIKGRANDAKTGISEAAPF